MKERSNQYACTVINSVTTAYHSEMKENNKIRYVIEHPSNISTRDNVFTLKRQ